MKTFFRPVRESTEHWLGAQALHEIRKLVAARLRVRSSELPAAIKQAFMDIERGSANYCWAFEEREDAEKMLKFTRSEHFRLYERPSRIQEVGTNLLVALFAKNCREIIEIQGMMICPHPHIGPAAGAGCVQTEAPWTIPRSMWLEAYGFGRRGLSLIKA